VDRHEPGFIPYFPPHRGERAARAKGAELPNRGGGERAVRVGTPARVAWTMMDNIWDNARLGTNMAGARGGRAASALPPH